MYLAFNIFAIHFDILSNFFINALLIFLISKIKIAIYLKIYFKLFLIFIINFV